MTSSGESPTWVCVKMHPQKKMVRTTFMIMFLHFPSFSSLNSLRYMQTTVVRAHFQTPKSSKPAPSRRAHLNFHLRPSWFLGLAGRGLNGDLMVIYELQCFSIRKIMENWSVELCLTASCRRVQHFSIFLVADEPNGWHMMLMAK